MGQPCSSCSSEKNKLKNKASQKRKNELASQNYKENANDHYVQGNIAIPHEQIPQVESTQINEKAEDNENPNQLYRPENEIELKSEKHANHSNNENEKNELGFSQKKVKQEFSFEKEKENIENEIEGIYEKPSVKFANLPYENKKNKSRFSQNKAKEDNSFAEEKKDDGSDNLYDENPENRPHHFNNMERRGGEQNVFHNIETDCPICLESFEKLGEEPVFTICGHAFCSKCLSGALKIHPYCPLCRTYQSKPLHDAAGQQLYDLNGEEGFEPLPEEQWNVEVVRAQLREIPGEEGNFNRRVYLSNGEPTNIFVGRGAKINVSPNANLFINGKRVENPQDCNVQ